MYSRWRCATAMMTLAFCTLPMQTRYLEFSFSWGCHILFYVLFFFQNYISWTTDLPRTHQTHKPTVKAGRLLASRMQLSLIAMSPWIFSLRRRFLVPSLGTAFLIYFFSQSYFCLPHPRADKETKCRCRSRPRPTRICFASSNRKGTLHVPCPQSLLVGRHDPIRPTSIFNLAPSSLPVERSTQPTLPGSRPTSLCLPRVILLCRDFLLPRRPKPGGLLSATSLTYKSFVSLSSTHEIMPSAEHMRK